MWKVRRKCLKIYRESDTGNGLGREGEWIWGGGRVSLCQSLFKRRCQVCWFKESFPRLNHVTQLESNIEISKISSYGVWSTHAVPATLVRSGFEPKSGDFLRKSLKFADIAAATASGCHKGGEKKNTKKLKPTCAELTISEPYCQWMNSVRACYYPKEIFTLIVWTIAKLLVVPRTKLKASPCWDTSWMKITWLKGLPRQMWEIKPSDVKKQQLRYIAQTLWNHLNRLQFKVSRTLTVTLLTWKNDVSALQVPVQRPTSAFIMSAPAHHCPFRAERSWKALESYCLASETLSHES